MMSETRHLAQIVDAHVHLWDPRRLRYPWLGGVSLLNRPFLPADFHQASAGLPVEKWVFVECDCAPDQSLAEVEWITELAHAERRLAGIVARAPLEQGAAVRPQLAELSRHPLVRGVRRILQAEADPDYCLRPEFVAGVQTLADFDLSCDLCIVHPQLAGVIRLVRQCPQVRFILDHIGKPAIRDQRLDPWRQQLRELAMLPNVWCKLSGLATEADPHNWRPAQLAPFVDLVLECFTFQRVVFGGDWPVCTLATSYSRWVDTLLQLLLGVSTGDLDRLFRANALEFYRL